MSLIETSIRRPVTVFIGAVAAIVFGVVAFRDLATDLLPDVTYPSVTIRTPFPGAAPQEVESLVTRPVENAVGVVNGLVRVASSSRPEVSEVTLEFAWGTAMDFAALDVRERLDLVRLPLATEPPVLLRYDPSLDPILRLGLTGSEDLMHLRQVAEERVQRSLERIEGVAAAVVQGGLEEEIQVELDERRLASLGLDPQALARRLDQENINLTGGRLRDAQADMLVRTVNELLRPEDLEALVVDADRGALVRLEDVATVRRGYKDREIITRIDGRESVEIAVYKAGGTNTVQVSETVLAGLDAVRERLAKIDPDLEITVITDQARYISRSVDEVLETALYGGLLAVLVLYLFLRSLRTTLIIALAIPISVVATFFLMYLSGVSLNIMSLGGLTLGIGLLVDNAIVVLEAIQRRRDEGLGIRDAAGQGASEVATAIVASTITSICVFLPIIFVEGVAAQFFGDQALTVTYSLLVSLLVALTVIPMLASRDFLGEDNEQATTTDHQSERTTVDHQSERTTIDQGSEPTTTDHPSERTTIEDGSQQTSPRARSADPDTAMESGTKTTQSVDKSSIEHRTQGNSSAPREPHGSSAPREPYPEHSQEPQSWLGRKLFNASVAVVRAITKVGAIVLRPFGWLIALPARAFQVLFDRLAAVYGRLLDGTLKYPAVVVLLAFGVLAASSTLYPRLGQELVPELIQGEFTLDVKLPPGTHLDVTQRRLFGLERIAAGLDGVERVYAIVGSSGQQGGVAGENREHLGQLVITVAPPFSREREEALMAELRDVVQGDPELEVQFGRPSYFSFKTPVEVELRGYNLTLLRRLSDRLVADMERIPGLTDVESSAEGGTPELRVRFDRDRLASLGLDLATAASMVQTKVQGTVATEIQREDRTIDIRVRSAEAFRDSARDLRNLVVVQRGDTALPLSAVATVEEAEGPAEIRRADGERTAVITANLEGRDLASVTADIEAAIDALDLPTGFDWQMGGQSQEMETSFDSMQLALALAVFLVYLVMASQFESLLHPLVILGSVPLALVGVLVTLALFEVRVSVVVLIGVVMLAGIVVNNAIILVDTTNRLRRDDGLTKIDALAQAGRLRLRPILMTTATTVLGLLPMAIGLGEGSELRAPMALAVIGGLLSSTVLTLLVIPAVYRLVDFGR